MKHLLMAGLVSVFASTSQAQTLCPDGSFVNGPCRLAPNGSFVGGNGNIQLAPNGTYTNGNREWLRTEALSAGMPRFLFAPMAPM